MEIHTLLSVALFAATMTGTPGPNNMMLTASGALFGYRRTLPHMLGICLGMFTLILATAAGLGLLFSRFPMIQEGLKWLASAYLLYLAWRIASAPAPSQHEETSERPMNVLEAASFQYVNPKAWAMAIAAIGTFSLSGGDYWLSALMISSVFMVIGFPCISIWAGFGTLIGRWLSTDRQWRLFNLSMGIATASCLIFIW
ncbi:LysE family translocator [Parendozoicomonas haliclonae]|uniref:Cysteine/O-acetylserine efflux protein n=1 Tax=Parendozoicomonas haliclonae TaxID=1960125 RepID=A0A1X7ANR8_9GAMM|nr:LysE family translocator [Parendozoicomonas haliclonae]SMA49783.1 Cysteine/O-acetylserine efflux protein [Parendozoicomonas haliclonae]